jgi:hypothetical protein
MTLVGWAALGLAGAGAGVSDFAWDGYVLVRTVFSCQVRRI